MRLSLTLICHAATAASRAGRFPADEPVEEAAGWPAEAGAAPRADRSWSSPALRARQTAAALGLAATVDAALRDLDCARWTGRRLSDLEREEPAALAAWLTDPAASPHGGESIADLAHRVGTWLDGVSGADRHAVAVTHAAVIRAAILHAIGAPPASFWRIDVPPLSRTRLSRLDGRWRLQLGGNAYSAASRTAAGAP